MLISLDEYRAKLIYKILFASSQEEVKRFIDTAIKALKQNNVNRHIIARFIEKLAATLNYLTQFIKKHNNGIILKWR